MGFLRTFVQDIVGATRITADSRSRRQLTWDFVLYRITKIVPWPGMDRERSIRLKDDIIIHYRLNRGDIWAIHEMWVEEVYRLPHEIKPEAILDLGANIGLASLYLAKRYDVKRVVGVEPSTSNADLARRNLCDNGIQADIVEAAVGPEDGFAIFHASTSATNGHVEFVPQSKAQKAEHLGPNAVSMVSVPTLVKMLPKEKPPHLVKMDIEGGEGPLLNGDISWLEQVKWLIGEFHVFIVDYPDLKAKLQSHGLKGTYDGPVTTDVIEFFAREA